MSTALTVHDPASAAVSPPGARLTILKPVAPVGDVINAQSELRSYIKQALVEDRDYGEIPGVEKASLFKAGAERINAGYGVVPRYTVLEQEVDHFVEVPWIKRKKRYEKGTWTGDFDEERGTSIGLYRYVVRCELVHRETGIVIADSIGTCSTLESKYIDRPRDAENTAVKMAQKRAYVGATLHAYGLSDEFTQDVEDTGVGADATPGEGPAKVKPPVCPTHNKPMKDQRASKKNPKAPDWKCTVKTDGKWCEHVMWPGQWPPKGEGAEGNGSAPETSTPVSGATGTANSAPSTTSGAAPAGAPPATGTADPNVWVVGRDLAEMTLEHAMALPLLGGPDKWNGNGGKPLGIQRSGLLRQVRTFFAKKLEEDGDDPRLEAQIHAITLILDEREKDQTKMELGDKTAPDPAPGSTSATVPPPGKVEDALKPNAKPVAPGEMTSPNVIPDDIPF
jgi:hypothetical protein